MILRNGKLKLCLHITILPTIHSKFQRCNPLVNFNIQTNTNVCLAIPRGREQLTSAAALSDCYTELLPKQPSLGLRQTSFDPSWCCYFEVLSLQFSSNLKWHDSTSLVEVIQLLKSVTQMSLPAPLTARDEKQVFENMIHLVCFRHLLQDATNLTQEGNTSLL